MIYLDNNATAILAPEVAETVTYFAKRPLGNPSSPHAFGQEAKSLLSSARRHIAGFLKAKQGQIIFTSGGSEGAALCLKGLGHSGHIISSNIEHACVYEILESFRQKGAVVTYLPAGKKGAIDPTQVREAIRPETKLITIMAVNNETGVMQNLEEIAAIAEQASIPLVVDGVAWLGKAPLHIPAGVSAMFFSGHKIHAPQGVGFVYVHPRTKLKPLIEGGSQEFNMRGGTENMLGILALEKAISFLAENQAQAMAHMQILRDRFENALLQMPGVTLNGTGSRVCNTSNLCFAGMDGETFLIALDQAGVAASLGSACSSGAIEPSRILLAMGHSLTEARSSLRFSFSRLNTLDEVERAIQIIQKTYQNLKK